ncbi:cadherin-like domain-containing protein [Undibacterium sp. CY7W]|uniref:Cadherin-like domain-containing protein n=1 Tax=Undibacterium rugosum TaxID=2762291 RepID=A0A923KZK4_9BURK|nr:Ig-like domain-containing protein [Undibacterium rugosum]MBC3936228.1 cadherin-like domain-containing protein [Undibacterium rugosum]
MSLQMLAFKKYWGVYFGRFSGFSRIFSGHFRFKAGMRVCPANPKKRGDVLIFDLDTLSMKTGKIAAPFVVQRPADNLSGKVPHTIAATKDPDQFLVSSILDYDKGLSTLQLTRDENGHITDATMTPIKMGQQNVSVDRLDIQRADSSVLVEKDGVDYAIVADDNYNYNDPYYRAMFEPPMFLWTPGGSPILFGGSVSAQKVAVGGKLGIIQDPFGKKGDPKFLGSTLPLDGYGIRNLSVSEDGKVLLGQLYGGYGTDNPNVQKEHQTHVWNVDAMIDAALAMTDKSREIHHIKFTDKQNDSINNEQRVDAAAGVPIGTYFDPEIVFTETKVNMGDVTGIDLREETAKKLLVQENVLTAEEAKTKTKDLPDGKRQLIYNRMSYLSDFHIPQSEIDRYKPDGKGKDNALKLLVKPVTIKHTEGGKATEEVKYQPITTMNLNSAEEGDADDFTMNGIIYVLPNITDDDVKDLRAGETLNDKFGQFTYNFEDRYDPKTQGRRPEELITHTEGWLSVTAKDYANVANTFFGDRDLKNPGYSEFKLSGGVGTNQANNVLDVYKVEQRLKYLGYSAFGVNNGTTGTLKELKVDGKLNEHTENGFATSDEASALRAFYGATHYTQFYKVVDTDSKSGLNGYQTTKELDKAQFVSNVNGKDENLEWLNAFNAPHWMDIFKNFDIPAVNGKNSANFLNGEPGAAERYSTSWTRDLIAAWINSKGAQGLTSGKMQINGLSDPTRVTDASSHNRHAGHSVGLGLDLGILQQYISDDNQKDTKNNGPDIDFSVELGKAYNKSFAASGASAFTYAVTAGSLPPGLSLNPNTGKVSGTPTAIGNFTGTITARNTVPTPGAQNVLNQEFKIAVFDHPGWSVANAITWSDLLPKTSFKNDQAGALKNFLSIYALTQKDNIANNGTWDELSNLIVNGEKVHTALFGSGLQDEHQLLQNVWIGGRGSNQNPFPNMRAVLGRLGFTNSQSAFNPLPHTFTQEKHHNHFHIDLRPPARVAIEQPHLLLAQSPATDANTPVGQAIGSTASKSAMQALLEAAQSELELEEGETSMFVLDHFVMSAQSTATMLVQTNPARQGLRKERVMGVCKIVANGPDQGVSVVNAFDPAHEAYIYLKRYEHKIVSGQAKVTVLQPPKHGLVRLLDESDRGVIFPKDAAPVDPNDGTYLYLPENGYLGKDRATILVELGGKKVKIIYFFEAVDGPAGEPETIEARCPYKVSDWKISSNLPEGTSGFTNWQTTANLNAMLANASGSLTNFSDLAGSAVGQTTGQGKDAQITLDTNAAGHGWFIDSTPDQNDEFLPTSNPDVWIAKSGSAADGKMDMLSVLLHEYGHALGIEHSADDGDFMAASLQPGERRLPSPDELSLMARLVAALKQTSADPTASGLPVSNVSLISWYRLRRADYGWVLDTDQTQLVSRVDLTASQAAQKETAVNNTLSQNSNDWQTLGDVRSNNTTVTLGESNQANAHLTQSFAVKQGDRYLSFTVANNGMQSNGVDEDGNETGPDDAFEVALLNANTGASEAGTDGLTHSDAILNIQSDGTEHKSSSVRKVHNADGSDTYFVDLQQAVNNGNGLVTGTPVSLSFDLMGFGIQNSHVSLRDIKLVQDPVAFDDAVSSKEDATATIDVLSNDLLGGGVASSAAQLNIVSQPAHGSISINPDGTISYVPAAHFYGNDSFSYTTTVDGRVSNQATVTLHVSHVNHAPVVTSDNVAMAVTAGKPVAFNPLVNNAYQVAWLYRLGIGNSVKNEWWRGKTS